MKLELVLEEILPGDDWITIQSNPISRDCRKNRGFDSIRFDSACDFESPLVVSIQEKPNERLQAFSVMYR